MPYTPREYAERHFIYSLCNNNAREVARVYTEQYTNTDNYPENYTGKEDSKFLMTTKYF